MTTIAPMQTSFKTLFAQAKSYKKQLVMGNLTAIAATAVSVPIPLLMPLLVDEVLLEKPGFLASVMETLFHNPSPVTYVAVVLATTVVLRFFFFLLSVLHTKVFTSISKRITYRLRKSLLTHLGRVSMAEFEELGSGNAASRLVTDVETVDAFLGVTVSRFFVSFLTILGIAGVLLLIHWQLALFILLVNPAVIWFTMVLGRKTSKLKKKENKAFELFQEALAETLEAFGQIRAANREGHYVGKLVERTRELRDYAIDYGWKSDGAGRFSFLVFLAGFEVFRGASILMVAYSDLSIGLMLAIFGYLWFMMGPVQELLNIQYSYHNAKAALERLNKLFALAPEPDYPALENPFVRPGATSALLEKIHFAYGDQAKPVLDGVTLELKAGHKVALVGASGSGKTTLARILVGFYPAASGRIHYGGVAVEKIGLGTVREHVALILQTPWLLNDTLRANLAMGREHSDEEILAALETAQLGTFVRSLEKGLETKVGKGGVRLSGGQRQRVAIARAVLQNPKIVIFDESTSALDVHTEADLFASLEGFFKDRTVLIIAHRLSTVTQTDYVYMMDAGRIVQHGTHEELMNDGGHYEKFVTKQLHRL